MIQKESIAVLLRNIGSLWYAREEMAFFFVLQWGQSLETLTSFICMGSQSVNQNQPQLANYSQELYHLTSGRSLNLSVLYLPHL